MESAGQRLFPATPPTLVHRREDLQRIWHWELASGHYPSRQRSAFILFLKNLERVFQQAYIVPEQLRLKNVPENPALPPRRTTGSTQAQGRYATETKGTGSKRIYLDIQSSPENVAYPPRPVPGSVADLDIVMDHCDFSEKKVCSSYALSSPWRSISCSSSLCGIV